MKHLRLRLTFSLALIFTTITQANPIFSCTTEKNKIIYVEDFGPTLSYSFGYNLNQPELRLIVPRNHASTWQWDGMGRYINYSVTIPNGAYSYSVFKSIDRHSHTITAGVEVSKNNQYLTTVNCRLKTLHESLEGINLPRNSY